MDRILYFRITGKKEKSGNYRVQIFRNRSHGKDIIYLQLCGYPGKEQVPLVQGEMQKALERILTYGKKEEKPLPTYMVYEYGFEKWLENVEYATLWRRLWHLPVYDAFHEKENAEYMLAQVPADCFPSEMWILGYGPDMKDIISELSAKIIILPPNLLLRKKANNTHIMRGVL